VFPSRESRLRRELTELKEQSEPVLHVPGRGQALAVERVELVHAIPKNSP
jgi:4-aminobutyrate aminotransferase-like enzyme